VVKILEKLFGKKKPISITISKSTPAPANKPSIPKSEPAITIKMPQEEEPKLELPAHHLQDAHTLSQIVTEVEKKPIAQSRKAAAEPVATVDQLVASLPKTRAVRKKATKATVEDVVAALPRAARRKQRAKPSKPTRKKSKR
jgi:hypothetical protein